MNKEVSYLFQLTKKDLKELFDGANPKPGFCVSIEKSDEGVTIGLDKKALALAINGFVRNGGAQTNAAGCVNVSFDPPS